MTADDLRQRVVGLERGVAKTKKEGELWVGELRYMEMLLAQFRDRLTAEVRVV